MNFTLKKSDLNFKVYTVASKPTTAGAENDIAIISSVPMSNWIMSPEKPSGAPRSNGDVCIQYSTKGSTRNILKQNSMMIAMLTAYQYVDGAWVNREAVSYQGDEWVDWITTIPIPMTSDVWKPVACLSDNTVLNGAFSDGAYTVTTSGTKQSASIGTKNKITIPSETKTISAHVEISKAVGVYGRFYFYISNSSYIRPETPIAEVAFNTEYNGDVKMDVSSVSGDYYLVIALATWNDVAQIKGVVCKYSNVRMST